MKTPVAGLVLAGLLSLAACAQMARPSGPPPGGPNDPVPAEYLRGTQIDQPSMDRYSWGIEDSPSTSERNQVRYTWAEVRQRLAAAKR
jgi:hypothetical protein